MEKPGYAAMSYEPLIIESMQEPDELIGLNLQLLL